MTVHTATPGKSRTALRDVPPARSEKLVPFPDAAKRLGRSADTLRMWADAGHLPAVTTPGGQWSTYESFLHAVLASARPGCPGRIEDVARTWFAQRGITPEAVA